MLKDNAYYFFSIYSIVVFLFPTINIGIPLRFEDLIIIIYLIINFKSVFRNTSKIKYPIILQVLFVLFLYIGLCISILEGYNVGLSDFNTIFMNIKSIIIFVIAYNISNNKDINKIMKHLSIGIFISSIIAIIQYYNLFGVGKMLYLMYGKEERIEYGVTRAIGSIGNPNNASFYFLNLFIICMVFFKGKSKILALIPMIASIVTFSRTGVVSITLLLILFFVLSKIKIYKKILIIILLLIASTNLPSNLIDNTRFEVIAEDDKVIDTSMGGRSTLIWENKLQNFYDKPLLGIGTQKNNSSDTAFEITVFDNSYLYILITSGLIGFLLYLLFYINIFKNILSKNRDSNIKLYTILFLCITLVFFITTDLVKNIFYISFNMFVLGVIKSSLDNKNEKSRTISNNTDS